MQEDQRRQQAEKALLAAMVPGAYLCEIKSIRQMMKDEDFRRYYGHMLLWELMPVLEGGEAEKQELALTLSQVLELSKDATNARLRGCAEAIRDDLLPFENENTPCLTLGIAMFMMLFSSPHMELCETEEALALFRGLSADMPADTLFYAVMGDREYWQKDLREDDAFHDRVCAKILDLQLLGVRGAINSTLAQAKH